MKGSVSSPAAVRQVSPWSGRRALQRAELTNDEPVSSPGEYLATVVFASERSMGMSAKRRALGRGLGALIPTSPDGNGSSSPMDVFFKGNTATRPNDSPPVSRETTDGSDLGTGSNAATATAVLDLAPVPGARYAELPVLSIRPNPKQPRKAFGDDEMAELVHSISEIGILQPVVVRPIPSDELVNMAGQSPDGVAQPHFELIMGERRWRATQAAGLAVIPAIIKDTHDDDLLRDALLENLHRSELNALEEAAAYQQLLDDFGCTHDELACLLYTSDAADE